MQFQESDCKKCLVIHFDGKSITDITAGKKETKERIAIICSSQCLSKPQVPKTESGCGSDIVDTIMEFLVNEDWDLREYLCVLSFDTTAANTGKSSGALLGLNRSGSH